MLRCWEVRSPEPGGPATWRFGVEDPHTGQKHGFADLDAFLYFIEHELAVASHTGHPRRVPGEDDTADLVVSPP
jgi:hypothetical protein